MAENSSVRDVLAWTSQIVGAHVGNNSVGIEDLPDLIRKVHDSLAAVAGGGALNQPQAAVPVRKSVTQDYIVCLEDGRKLKMLKRHLKTVYDQTPEQYRERWGLPADYPMVAPNYARQRSVLAKKRGLGKRTRTRAGSSR